MKRNGKMKLMPALTILAIVLVIAASGAYLWNQFGGRALNIGGGVSDAQLKELAVSAALSCPTNGLTAFTLDVANFRNDTGAETFDVTAYVKNLETGAITTITDTTSPSASNIDCGKEHEVEIVRANADDGDNSRVSTIINGGSNAQVTSEGTVKFVPTSAVYSLRLGVAQHGVLEFRAYNNDAAGFMCNGDDTCTDYETDGVSFQSTTNGTALVVATGGQIDMRLEARATRSDTDFNDHYTLILVEAPTATWNEPTVKVDGVSLSNVKGSLNVEEAIAFAGYEYVYRLDKSIRDGGDGIDVDFYMVAKSGVNPSVDPEIDFATAGRYLSINGVTTKVGAADDTSSNAVVFDVQDVTIDIS